MIKRTQIRVNNKCKADGCEKFRIIGFNGFCNDHVPQLLKIEKVKKRQKQHREAQGRAISRKRLHEVQREVGKPQFVLKRQNKPIAKASKKRLVELRNYSVLRKDYLKDFPNCQAKLEGCKKKATDIHHQVGRGANLNNTDTWISICRPCHVWVTEHSKEAIELGLSISRLKLINDTE